MKNNNLKFLILKSETSDVFTVFKITKFHPNNYCEWFLNVYIYCANPFLWFRADFKKEIKRLSFFKVEISYYSRKAE